MQIFILDKNIRTKDNDTYENRIQSDDSIIRSTYILNIFFFEYQN